MSEQGKDLRKTWRGKERERERERRQATVLICTAVVVHMQYHGSWICVGGVWSTVPQ